MTEKLVETPVKKLQHIMFTVAQELNLNGVSVYPIPDGLLQKFDIKKYLREQKEYISIDDNTEFIISNFGAHGNPSSQHHPLVRDFRMEMFRFVKQSLENDDEFAGKYLQSLPDRFSQRFKKPSKEAWHKDVSIDYETFTNSIILGGWANLDETDQFFSCIIGSHLEPAPGEGFASMSKDNTKMYKARKTLVRIPPGHAISFDEKITHEIADVELNGISRRLYMKYHISSDSRSAFDTNIIYRTIQTQGLFQMNQWNSIPMYEKIHLMFWNTQLVEFGKNIKPVFLAKPNKKGNVYVQRYMISLLEAGVGMFPEYREEEIEILFPMKM
jgi:hypothetical protein